jgi:hypothetical protein
MKPESRPPLAKVYVEDYDVNLRLHQLGITGAPLVEAAQQGHLQRRLCTSDDFYAAPGFLDWTRTLRTMRKEMRSAHNFYNGDFLQIPVTFSPNGLMAIAVTTGDEWTGINGDKDPTTRDKGPQTYAAVVANRDPNTTLDLDYEDQGVDLWYLMRYINEDDELLTELSLPRFTNEKFEINGWYERILFGRIDPHDDGVKVIPPVAPSNIDIPVERKYA